MAGNGDLIRSIRAGGGAGVAAARELLRRAEGGTVTRAELKEVQRVVTSPELRDAFREVAGDVSALLSGGEVFRDVEALRPDTQRLTDARTLPERFLGDFTVMEQALLGHPGMGADEKAGRLFAFFETYAGRFAELAFGPPQALTPAELHKALAQFDKALTRAGFGALRTDDGRTGTEAARQMLEAKTRELQLQVRPERLTGPGLQDNPRPADRSLRGEVDRERRAVQTLDQRPLVQPQLRAGITRTEEAPGASGKRKAKGAGTDQVLGGRMLWNVLHLLRGDDLDDVARKDALTQLAIAAALLLTLGAIIAIVLVWM